MSTPASQPAMRPTMRNQRRFICLASLSTDNGSRLSMTRDGLCFSAWGKWRRLHAPLDLPRGGEPPGEVERVAGARAQRRVVEDAPVRDAVAGKVSQPRRQRIEIRIF